MKLQISNICSVDRKERETESETERDRKRVRERNKEIKRKKGRTIKKKEYIKYI